MLRRSRLPPLTPPLSAPPPSLPPSPPPSPLPSPPASSPAPPQPLHLNGPKGSAGWSLPFRLARRAPPPLPRDASPQTPSSTSSLSQESRESAFRQATSKEAASSALGTAATWAALALSPLNAEALYLLPWRRRSYFRLPTLAMCVCVSAVALLHSGGILVVSLQLLAAANAKADDLDDEGRLAAVYLAVYVSLLLAVAGLLLRVGRLCAISARALNLSAAVIRPAKLGRFAMRREQGSQKGGARPATAAEARARATAARQEEARLLEEAAAAASMYQVHLSCNSAVSRLSLSLRLSPPRRARSATCVTSCSPLPTLRGRRRSAKRRRRCGWRSWRRSRLLRRPAGGRAWEAGSRCATGAPAGWWPPGRRRRRATRCLRRSRPGLWLATACWRGRR